MMGGFKLDIPISAKYSTDEMTLTNEAFYKSYDNKAKDQIFAGCGTFSQSYNGSLNFNPSLLLALETGMQWRLGTVYSMFVGVYFDYGLSNSLKDSQKTYIKYDRDNPRGFSTNSVVSLETDPVKLMAVGLKLRLSMVK